MQPVINNPQTVKRVSNDRPILIAMVTGDFVHADFAFSLAQLFGYSLSQGIRCGISIIKGTVIDSQRNMAVRTALEANASHLLFIDTDMAFQPDALHVLLSREKPVVGVTYCTRRQPFVLTHCNYSRAESEADVEKFKSMRTIKQDAGFYEVGSLGCGMMLIETNVLRDICENWFVADTRTETGEDTHFCEMVRETGNSVWLDVDLSKNVRHCGMHYYALTDAKPADGKGNYL